MPCWPRLVDLVQDGRHVDRIDGHAKDAVDVARKIVQLGCVPSRFTKFFSDCVSTGWRLLKLDAKPP